MCNFRAPSQKHSTSRSLRYFLKIPILCVIHVGNWVENAHFHLFVIIGDESKSIASVVHIDQSTKLAEFGLKILIKNNYKFKHNIFKNLDICIGEESAPVTKGLNVFGLLPGIHFEEILSCERQTACTLSHHLFPSRFSFLCRPGVTKLFRQGPSTNSRETLNIC